MPHHGAVGSAWSVTPQSQGGFLRSIPPRAEPGKNIARIIQGRRPIQVRDPVFGLFETESNEEKDRPFDHQILSRLQAAAAIQPRPLRKIDGEE